MDYSVAREWAKSTTFFTLFTYLGETGSYLMEKIFSVLPFDCLTATLGYLITEPPQWTDSFGVLVAKVAVTVNC